MVRAVGPEFEDRVWFSGVAVATEVVAAPTIPGLTATDKKAVALARIIAPRTAIAYLKLMEPPPTLSTREY